MPSMVTTETVVVKSDPDEEDIVMEDTTTANDDGDDDEVVREINVLLSPSMASQLYLMQFPLRQQQRHNSSSSSSQQAAQVRLPSSSQTLPEAARIKSHHGMIELDEDIPFFSNNDGLWPLEQRTLTSHTIPVSTHMALGKMSDRGDLHLVPLSHITQMRPSFTHVDNNDNDNNNETSGGVVVDDDGHDDNSVHPQHGNKNKKMEKKPILFQKKETERAAMARKSSYAYKKASQDSESWQMLIVCGPDTIQHRQATKNLLCTSPSTTKPLVISSAAGSNVNDSDSGRRNDEDASSAFVHSLNYLPPPVHDVDDADVATSGNTTTSGDESSLGRICVKLMTSMHRGGPVPFSLLRHQFAAANADTATVVGVDDQDLLTALSSCAFLVRGNFVLQSRLMSLTPPLQQARTFILFLLQRVGHVERGRLEHVFGDDDNDRETSVTSEAIQMLLEQVASRGAMGWRSKLEDNLDFYDLYPEHTQLHDQFWDRQEIRFEDFLRRYNEAQV